MKIYLEEGINSMVDIHNLPDAPPNATLKRKRMANKYGEGTYNPLPPSLAKLPKKSKTSRRVLRYATIKGSEEQSREAAKAVEQLNKEDEKEFAKVPSN